MLLLFSLTGETCSPPTHTQKRKEKVSRAVQAGSQRQIHPAALLSGYGALGLPQQGEAEQEHNKLQRLISGCWGRRQGLGEKRSTQMRVTGKSKVLGQVGSQLFSNNNNNNNNNAIKLFARVH